ncbi:MAG: hypothetical protein U0935_18840 [Pirellulales bacterium]
MADSPAHASLLQELDARQDDLLAKLAELNLRVEDLLKQYLESRTQPTTPSDEGTA